MPVMTRVTPEETLSRAQSALGDDADVALNFGQLDIVCEPSALVETMTKLRDDDRLQCRFFTFLSAVDRSEYGPEDKPEKRGGLEVLIHVYSPDSAIHANVHVPVDANDAHCPTLTGVYMGASWHERETWEMFGIHFDGHPRLVNLYLPEDFDGNPGLRSFKLPSRLIKDWPGAKDPEEAAAGGR